MYETYVCQASYSAFADVVYSYISIQVEGSAVGILSPGKGTVAGYDIDLPKNAVIYKVEAKATSF